MTQAEKQEHLAGRYRLEFTTNDASLVGACKSKAEAEGLSLAAWLRRLAIREIARDDKSGRYRL